MKDKFLVSYSPILNDYVMICIGGENEKNIMQDYIDARGIDEILMEVTKEKYEEIYNNMEFKHVLCKFNH